MSFLDDIILHKKKEVQASLAHISGGQISRTYRDERIPLDFKAALTLSKKLSFITEIKKASPSKGVIRENFNPVWIAWEYYNNQAACLSVVTDEHFFQGKNAYLTEIRSKYKIPTLRKDFVVDARQIREAYDIGADAVLLIAACLTRQELEQFKALAAEFGLASLVEVHTPADIEKISALNFDLIGINNRDLETFKVSLEVSKNLIGQLPRSAVKISESGITTPQDCAVLSKAGFDAVLIGEHFMRQPSPGMALRALMKY